MQPVQEQDEIQMEFDQNINTNNGEANFSEMKTQNQTDQDLTNSNVGE